MERVAADGVAPAVRGEVLDPLSTVVSRLGAEFPTLEVLRSFLAG
jgi:hypothetical protein